MILNDDVEFERLRDLKEFHQTIRTTNLLFVGVPLTDGVHTNGVAADFLREREPLLMICGELRTRCVVGCAAEPFAIAHDEFALHVKVVAALAEFASERLFTNAARVELIDEFDARDAELFFRDLRKVHRIGWILRTFLGLAKAKASME